MPPECKKCGCSHGLDERCLSAPIYREYEVLPDASNNLRAMHIIEQVMLKEQPNHAVMAAWFQAQYGGSDDE